MSKAKYYCFTLNNYNDANIAALTTCINERFNYICWAKEVGASGTPHLQGYIECTIKSRMAQIHRLTGVGGLSLHVRKGTQEQAILYCSGPWTDPKGIRPPKPVNHTFVEYGVKSELGQGKRTDLKAAVDAMKDGSSIRDLYKDHTEVMVKFGRGMKEAFLQLQPERPKKVFELDSFVFHPILFEDGYSHILVGESGCGKTSYIRSLYPECLFVSHMDDLVRFDPTTHSAILFDDMSFTHLHRGAQIHIVDQDDDRSIHVRYTTAFIPAGTKKFFTTNERDIFLLTDPAIKRRVKVHTIINRLG